MPPKPSHKHKPLVPLPKVLKLSDSYYYLDEYEGDTKTKSGGFRAWEEAHELVMERFYSQPPLVSPKRPHEWHEHLQEHGFASRERGRAVNAIAGQSLLYLFNDPDFEETYLKPFEAKTVEQREDLVLKALSDEVRTWEYKDSTIAEWRRKLCPEITLNTLCSGDGKGLRRLIDSLRSHLSTYDINLQPFPQSDFDRMFALGNSSPALPLSKSSRAFQEETTLVRHSTLFIFVRAILNTVVGIPIKKGHSVGNIADELTHDNSPSLIGEPLRGKKLKEKQADLPSTSESCTVCRLSPAELNIRQLKRCGACLKVGRVHLYCSSECQRADWPDHRKTCGEKLSAVSDVPVFHPPSPEASAPPPFKIAEGIQRTTSTLRKRVLGHLDDDKHSYWIVLDRRGLVLTRFTVPDKLDRAKEILSSMRNNAFRALRKNDFESMDLLACLLLSHQGFSNLRDKPSPYSTGKGGTAWYLQDQFEQFFPRSNDELIEAMKRGKSELDKPERWAEKALYEHKRDEAARAEIEATMSSLASEDVPEPISDCMRLMLSMMFGLDDDVYEAFCDPDEVAKAKEEGIWEEMLRENRKKKADKRTKSPSLPDKPDKAEQAPGNSEETGRASEEKK